MRVIEFGLEQGNGNLWFIILESRDRYRRATVKALGVIGEDAVPSVVEALLNSDNVTVRGSAAKVLAEFGINYPELPFPEAGLQGLKKAVESLNTTDNVAVQVAIVNPLASVSDRRG